MEEEKEMLENVEHALKNFNGRAIDCIAIGEMLIKYNKLKEDNKELRKYYASRKEVEDLKETIACLHESSKEFIPISVIQNTLKEIDNRNYNDYTNNQDGNEVKNNILKDIQELLEKGNK